MALGRATTAECSMAADGLPWAAHRAVRGRAAAWGLAAGGTLLLVYVLILGWANSLRHALDEFVRLWPWMTVLTIGFAAQVGLFAYARRAARENGSGGVRGVAASGGTSVASMVACCAHHLTDILPFVGLAGAAFFLASYQWLFLLLGVLSNGVGVVFMLGQLRKHGLHPTRRSLLALSVGWPADRALPYVLAGSVAIFGLATGIALG